MWLVACPNCSRTHTRLERAEKGSDGRKQCERVVEKGKGEGRQRNESGEAFS